MLLTKCSQVCLCCTKWSFHTKLDKVQENPQEFPITPELDKRLYSHLLKTLTCCSNGFFALSGNCDGWKNGPFQFLITCLKSCCWKNIAQTQNISKYSNIALTSHINIFYPNWNLGFRFYHLKQQVFDQMCSGVLTLNLMLQCKMPLKSLPDL